MNRRTKGYVTAVSAGTAAVPAIAKFNLVAATPGVAYLLITYCLVMVGGAAVDDVPTPLIVLMASSFVLAMFAAYQAPLTEDTLFVWDQHISAHLIGETMANGMFQDPQNPKLRGARATDLYPMFYAYGTSVGLVTGQKALFVVKILPGLLVPTVPFILAAAFNSQKKFAALVGVSPILFGFSAATTVAQMFALPLLGLLIIPVMASNQSQRWNLRIVFILAAVVVTLSHSLTPVTGFFLVAGLTLGEYLNQQLKAINQLVLFGIVLLGIWVFNQHVILLGALRSLLTGGINGVIQFFTLSVSYETTVVPVDRHVPRSAWFWLGTFLRILFFIALGVIFFVSGYRREQLPGWITHPYVISLVVAGPLVLVFSRGVGAVDLNRSWLMLTFVAVPSYVFVLSMTADERSMRGCDLLVIVLGSVPTALLLAGLRFHLSSAGPLPAVVLSVLGILVGVAGVSSLLLLIRSGSDTERILRTRVSTHVVVQWLVIVLLLGHAFHGVSAETFSSEQRQEAFTQPGLTRYHSDVDYATSAFIDRYRVGRVTGDSRVFLLEEYYRQNLTPVLACYVPKGNCYINTVVWYDTYTENWQGIDVVGPVHTIFPNGEQYLDRNQHKIFTTKKSSVYVD